MKEFIRIRTRAYSMSDSRLRAEILRCQVGIQKAARARDIARYELRISIMNKELASRSHERSV